MGQSLFAKQVKSTYTVQEHQVQAAAACMAGATSAAIPLGWLAKGKDKEVHFRIFLSPLPSEPSLFKLYFVCFFRPLIYK